MIKFTKLRIFDFDGTLVATELPETGKVIWKERTGSEWPHKGWWGQPDSLSDIFDNKVIESTREAYEIESQDPEVMKIMLTGRMANSKGKGDFEGAVKSILDSHGLVFHEYRYNYGGETSQNKINQIEKVLAANPSITDVKMWDDREEHIGKFREFGQSLIDRGLITEFEVIHVISENHN